MPGIFRDRETPELRKLLDKQGYFTLHEDCVRPLKVTKEFCADLEANDVFSLYKQGTMNNINNKTEIAEIAMIHGDADESASFEDAKRFAEQIGAKLTVVEGGKHRLMGPGQMELVLETAIEFFTGS
jgi:hypothetical protein